MFKTAVQKKKKKFHFNLPTIVRIYQKRDRPCNLIY